MSTLDHITFARNWMLFLLALIALAPAYGASNNDPVFTSQPVVSHNPAYNGEKLTFSAVATDIDNQTLTYSWQFGDGGNLQTTTATSIAHVYSVNGAYTVSVSVSDGVVSVFSNSFTVTVVDTLIGSGPDRDGDGFSDSFENQIGSNFKNSASTPLSGKPASGVSGYKITTTKAQISLHFDKKKSNEIKMSGILQAPANFSAANQKVVVNVGGHVVAFALDKRGKGVHGKSKMNVSLKGKTPKGVTARLGTGIMEYNWSVDIKQPPPEPPPQPEPYPFQSPDNDIHDILYGDIESDLEDEGLLDDDIGVKTSGGVLGVAVYVKHDILFGDVYFDENMMFLYTAEKGKSGTAKLPKPHK